VATLWSLIPSSVGGAELMGIGVGFLILFAFIRDVRERARFSRVYRGGWHEIDPHPAGGRHNHPPRVVRFDGK
jgi:hypothetical protein